MSRCKTCNTYAESCSAALLKRAPQWLVWCEEHGETSESGARFRAHDADEAAEMWAYNRDGGEYLIASGGTYTVKVKADAQDSEIQTFEVTGETVPKYSVWEVEADS